MVILCEPHHNIMLLAIQDWKFVCLIDCLSYVSKRNDIGEGKLTKAIQALAI